MEPEPILPTGLLCLSLQARALARFISIFHPFEVFFFQPKQKNVEIGFWVSFFGRGMFWPQQDGRHAGVVVQTSGSLSPAATKKPILASAH